jgi:hypothetical protein
MISGKYKILVKKIQGKAPLRRPRYKEEDNIRMDLGKWCGKVWTGCIRFRIGTSDMIL